MNQVNEQCHNISLSVIWELVAPLAYSLTYISCFSYYNHVYFQSCTMLYHEKKADVTKIAKYLFQSCNDENIKWFLGNIINKLDSGLFKRTRLVHVNFSSSNKDFNTHKVS